MVESALNDPVAAAIWKEEEGSEYSLEEGVTTFSAVGETREASLISILEEVVIHHGEYSHDPPLSVIEVIGLQPSMAVRDELTTYGFNSIEPSAEGFVGRDDTG